MEVRGSTYTQSVVELGFLNHGDGLQQQRLSRLWEERYERGENDTRGGGGKLVACW